MSFNVKFNITYSTDYDIQIDTFPICDAHVTCFLIIDGFLFYFLSLAGGWQGLSRLGWAGKTCLDYSSA